ncbi:hypothetical protein [Microbulbifer sp. THAF38]|uniref:hypothetical protein n=1 Tax=Microbulbifer sp. THAF38 TaxID=2587856 RepID=UPI0012688500|nr:hypothetical protein [Microbulbifer sp. THAF38]QFT55048.1 hypothetical protein FIU95_10820 [Microbulbifer sp. THAF38]
MSLREMYIDSNFLPKFGRFEQEENFEFLTSKLDTTFLNNRTIVIANGKGIRVFDQKSINQSNLNGWVCRFTASTKLPNGIKITEHTSGQYFISPERNMTTERFIELLKEMSLSAITLFKHSDKAV